MQLNCKAALLAGAAHTFFSGESDKPRAGELINVLREAGQPVPEELLAFGTTVKKKESKLYGAHFKVYSSPLNHLCLSNLLPAYFNPMFSSIKRPPIVNLKAPRPFIICDSMCLSSVNVTISHACLLWRSRYFRAFYNCSVSGKL